MKIDIEKLSDYSHDEIICSESNSRKKLIYRTVVDKPKLINRINFKSFFVVVDRFDKEITVTDFLTVALKVYNNMSDKEYHHLIEEPKKKCSINRDWHTCYDYSILYNHGGCSVCHFYKIESLQYKIERCSVCNGTGRIGFDNKKCLACKGVGEINKL